MGVGSLSSHLVIVVVGGSMAGFQFGCLFTRPGAYVVTALRLLALPLFMMLGLWALGFNVTLASIAVLLTAMPSASMNVIFAEQYGGNVQFAAASVVQSMLFMMGSLPLIVFLMERVF